MRRLAFALLAVAACGKPILQPVGGELSVEPTSLDFGRTPTGATVVRELTVRNGSKAARTVTPEVSAPFGAPGELRLEGAGSALLRVTFEPGDSGEATATLVLTSDGQRLEVPLRGEAFEPSHCAAGAACREVRTDLSTGECIEAPAPDGTTCATACLTGGACLAGTCVGAAVSCDDGDACTLDVCDPASGCASVPSIDACPSPSDPCRAATCDPQTGCGIADVPDGTPCGEMTCTTAHVCLQGMCTERATPNGATCGTVTPCRAAGVCVDQACVQPAATTLAPAWTYAAATGQITFPGLADRAGNLYWFETSPPSLVSGDRDGAIRFRVSLADVPQPAAIGGFSPAEVVADKALVVLLPRAGRIEARSTTDGSLSWQHDVGSLRASLGVRSGNMGFWFISASEGSGGDVLASIRTNYGGADWANWIVAFDVATGAVKWSKQYDYLNELIADRQGNAYTYVDLWEHRLVSLSPTGVERWNLLVGNSAMPGSAPPVAAVDSLLITGGSAVLRDTATGAARALPAMPLYVSGHWGPPPVVSATQLVVPDSNSICSSYLSTYAVPALTAGWTWSDTQSCLQDVALTSRGTVLFGAASRSGPAPVMLREIEANGSVRYECPVDAQRPSGFSVLDDERWVVFDLQRQRIAAFDVKGARLATTGWVSAFGGPARNMRQR